MISLKWCQIEIIKNKIKNGFFVGDTVHELNRVGEELEEAKDAYWNDPANLADELADVFIYINAIAFNENIDLEKAIRDKIERNKHRVWKTSRKNR